MTAPRKPRRTRRATPDPRSALAYIRVSTEEQVVSGLGLGAQRDAIAAKADALGLEVIEWFADEGIGGAVAPLDRPGLRSALDALASGAAEHLVVAKLDRLGRNAARVLDLDALAAVEGWGIVMCDLDIDTSTAAGRFMLGSMANAAEFERNLISERTRAALAVKKAQGVRLGRPPVLDREVVERIVRERLAGIGYETIARQLNHDEVPTARGGRQWYPSTVRAVERGAVAADVRQAIENTDK